MRLLRLILGLGIVLGLLVAAQGVAAQDPGDEIEALALRAHQQNLRAHNYTAWIGGPLGDPALAPYATPLGEQLTGWQLQGLAGDAGISSADLTRPTLLNFWASWCYPCQLEFPHLVRVALAPEDHEFDVIFVNVFDEGSAALTWLDGYPAEIRTALDGEDRLAGRLGIDAIPTSLLLDADGTVLVVHTGPLTATLTDFLDAVSAHPGEGTFAAEEYGYEPPGAVLAPVDVETAATIAFDEPMRGTLTDAAFQQAYRFEGHAGDTVTVSLAAEVGSDLDTYVALLTAEGESLAENDDINPSVVTDSTLTATLPADGTYIVVATRFLEADGFAGGDYSLTVQLTPAVAAQTGIAEALGGASQQEEQVIAYGETVSGTLDDSNYEDRWRFEGHAGDVVTVAMERAVDAPGGLDGYMLLLGPDGDTLLEADDSGDSVMPVINLYTLPADGAYVIVATRFGFANGFSAGDYALTLTGTGSETGPASAPTGTGPFVGTQWLAPGTLPPGLRWIAYNEAVSGRLTRDEYDDWRIFRGAAGDVITVRMTATGGDLDPFLILTDGSGVELARNDDADDSASDAAIVAFALPADGTYLIRATRYGLMNGPSTGEFSLVIDTGAESLDLNVAGPAVPLALGEVVTGTLSLERARDRYTFSGQAGEWVTISVQRADGDLDLALTLRDPDGAEIASDREWLDPAEARIERVQLPADGTYALDVVLEDLTTSGGYRLVALVAPPAGPSPGAFVPADGLDIELVLVWASDADLDLQALDPVGAESGDSTARANDFCANITTAPVERLVWADGAAAPGAYEVRIGYRLNCGGQSEPVNFTLAVVANGVVVDFINGSLAREGDVYTTRLEY